MRSKFLFRTRILWGLFVCAAVLMIVRLYFVQIVHGEEYQQDAQAQYVAEGSDEEDRGDIYFTAKDGELVPAAVMQTGWRIAIDPETLTDPQGTYAKLNAIVPVDQTRFFADVAKAGDPYEEVAFQVADDQADAIRALNLTGVLLVADQWRFYPAHDLAAQVIGFVGYQGTSTVKTGIYGLEKEYEDTLEKSGNGLYVNPFAEIFTSLQSAISSDPTAHEGSIVTSIEPTVQEKLQETLQQIMAQYTPQFAGGIIMDPHTGAIYAMAQEPSFDPNTYSAVTDPSIYTNILVSGRYEMGSIMKPLTMAAGIDSGAVTPATTYDDTGCATYSGAKVCNFDFKPRNVIPMGQILDQSLNVGAAWVATKTGYPTFADYMKAYDLGQKTGIDLPDEVTGDLSNLDDGTGPAVNYATAAFGQGISVSPIEMIRALSALANNGQLVDPHVVTAIKYDDGITRTIPAAEGPQVIKPATAQAVTQMLETVYDNYELNGQIKMQHYTAAAKTGTAQIPDPATGGYYPGEVYIHSFFGYFPASNPRFLVFLYAYRPIGQEYSAYTWDGPYYQLEQFLINYYNIPPDR